MADRERETGTASMDIMALVQFVVRESYLQNLEDLRYFAEKLRHFNASKQAIRVYLSRLQEFRTCVRASARELGSDLCRDSKDAVADIAELFDKHSRTYEQSDIEQDLCLPARVPPAVVTDRTRLEAEISCWEKRLASVGDAAQLTTLDLQNVLQKQQELLQVTSNISKITHDTTMDVIQNIRG